MKYFFYLIFSAFFLGLNFGLFGMLSFFGAVPNISLLLVIITSLFEDDNNFLFFAVVCGLILDYQYSMFPGSFSLGFILLGFFIQSITKRILAINLKSTYLPIFLLFGLAFIYLWLWFFSNIIMHFHLWVISVHLKYLFSQFLQNYIYNLVLLYPLYAVWLIFQEFLTSFSKRRQVIK